MAHHFSFIATGDHHFDEHRRFDECQRIHSFIADDARDRGVRAVLSGGDLYERASTPLERHAVADWLTSVGDHCPVVIAKGNHDKPRDCALMSRIRATHPIRVEEAAGIHYVDDAAILAVAWPNRASLAAMIGKPISGSGLDDVARECLRNVLAGFGLTLAQHQGPRILLMHGMVDGSVTSTGQPLIGSELHIGLEDLALSNADIAVLGHIHKPQDWTIGGMPVVYTGSSYRTAYGETEEKSVVYAAFEWEVVDGERRMSMRWERVPTPATKMLLLEYAWAKDGQPGFRDASGELFGDHVLHETAGAEVRFRYSFDPDKRDAAKAAAASLESQMREVGAADIKLDPRVNSVSRSRAEDVAAAPTLREKARLTWKTRGLHIDEDRAQRLLGMLQEIEGDAGLRLRGRGNVRIDSLAICGMGPFADKVELDLSAIDGDIVAITGANGEGKSTLLSTFPAAMYREFPTAPSPTSLTNFVRPDATSAYVEVKIDAGEVWAIRQTVKASGGGEALLLDSRGVPVEAVKTGKVTAFDEWAEKKLPPQDLFFASQFCAQKAGGIAGMSAAQRKDLVLALKDCDHLEEMAKRARGRAAATEKEIEKVAAVVAELERRLGGPVEDACATATSLLARAREDAASKERDVEESRERLRAAQDRAAAIQAERTTYDRVVALRADIRGRLGAAQDRLSSLRSRRAGLATLLDRADQIRTAFARLANLRGPEQALTEAIQRLEAEAVAAQKAEEAANTHGRAAAVRAVRAREDGDATTAPMRRMLAGLTEKVAFNRQRIAKNQTELLDQAEAIRAAVAEMQRIDQREHDLDLAIERNVGARSKLDGERHTLGHARACARAEVARQPELDGLLGWLDAKEYGILEAGAERDIAREAVEAAQHEVDAARAKLEEVQNLRGDQAIDRVANLRGGLRVIADGVEAPAGYAASVLASDEEAEAFARALPVRLAQWRATLTTAEAGLRVESERLAAIERTLAGAGEVRAKREEADALAATIAKATADVERLSREVVANNEAMEECNRAGEALRAEYAALRSNAPTALAARAPHLEMAAERVAGYRAEIAEAEAQIARLTQDVAEAEAETERRVAVANGEVAQAGVEADVARQEAEKADAERRRLIVERDAVCDEIRQVEDTAREADRLPAAMATAAEIDAQIGTAEGEVSRLQAELDGTELPPEPPAPPPVEGLAQAVAGYEGLARLAQRDLTLAEQRLADVQETTARIAAQRETLAALQVTLEDWNVWADTLGKDGLQALEVDAAGPEIARVATDLLHECHGPRWTIVRFDTAPAAKKGTKEGCDIIVADSKKGREGRIETFSPGQQAITGTALTLAVAILSARDGGAKDPTIVLDEAGAALDPENAEAWIAMVRRAREIIGASKVLHIAHLPRLVELSDACIHVQDGRIEVVNA